MSLHSPGSRDQPRLSSIQYPPHSTGMLGINRGRFPWTDMTFESQVGILRITLTMFLEVHVRSSHTTYMYVHGGTCKFIHFSHVN